MPSRMAQEPLPLWGSERLFFSASQWYEGIQTDIATARQSICLQTYIFNLDTVGEPLLRALCAASRRGIAVRVIVDGIGSSAAIQHMQQVLRANGAQLHVYHPLPWQWIANRLERGDWLTRMLSRLAVVNNRQHSKLCLIDGHTAWTGSFNITDDHIENHARGMDWKDCGVRVTGERCLLFREFFDAVWNQDVERLSSHFLYHPVTNFSPALRKTRLRTLLQQIHRAKRRIWIASAYFAPVPRIVRALKKAGKRGVDVRVVVPAHSDVRFFPALASTYYADLLRAGVQIYEYEAGILHSKSMLIDEAALIGSSNMNHRSMLHDIELDVGIFTADACAALEHDFIAGMQQSRAITLENLGHFYAWLLAFGQIPRLLRYWL